jgi:SPP1 gp7 family putative phage head morphogenesis protein
MREQETRGPAEVLGELRVVEAFIFKAARVREVSQVARIETTLRQLYQAEWQRLAERGTREAASVIRRGSGKLVTQTEINQALDTIDDFMGRWAGRVEERAVDDVKEAYTLAREAGHKKATRQTGSSLQFNTPPFSAKPVKKEAPEILPGFDVIDTEAVSALQRDQRFWIGQHYGTNVRRNIRDVARREMIEAGRDRGAAAKVLERLASPGGALSQVRVPGGFNGTSRQYFEGLAANAVTTARAQGQLVSFQKAGFISYEIVNPADDRTCKICSHMDGKVFTVAQGMQTMTAVLGAKTPKGVRQAQPWLGVKGMRAVSSAPGAAGAKDAGKLTDKGFNMPPFHFRCRCAVDVTEDEFTSGVTEVVTPPEAKKPPRVKEPKPRARVNPKPKKPKLPDAYKGDRSGAKPDGKFDKDALAKSLEAVGARPFATKITKSAQKEVRKQLNNLMWQEQMISSDLVMKASQRNAYRVKKMSSLGTHSFQGTISARPAENTSAVKFFSGKSKSMEDISGARTIVHEAVHSHSPITWSAYTGPGKWCEEVTTEMAARQIMVKRLGANHNNFRNWRHSGYHRPVNATAKLVEENIRKAMKKAGAPLQRFGGNAPSRTKFDEVIGEASIRMRTKVATRGGLISDPDKYVDFFAENIELPPEWAKSLTKAQIRDMQKDIAKEFKRVMNSRMTAF